MDLFSSEILAILLSTNSKLNKLFIIILDKKVFLFLSIYDKYYNSRQNKHHVHCINDYDG